MKSKEEIAKVLKEPHMATTEKCVCCGGPRTMGPTSEYCFRCHRKGCLLMNNGRKVRKCR